MMTLQKLAPAAGFSVACVLAALGLASGQSPRSAPAAPPAPKAAVAQKTPTPTAPESKVASTRPEAAAAQGAEAGPDPGPFVDFPAFVIKTEPPTGATDVDPALAQVRVTFSKEMSDGGWSWVTFSKETFPEITGKISYDKDRRTCTAPVKLEPDKLYAISLNSQKFVNFRDVGGRPAVPYMLVFKTRK
jgi:Bacterial Ig-like domain